MVGIFANLKHGMLDLLYICGLRIRKVNRWVGDLVVYYLGRETWFNGVVWGF